jgi:sulfhydrogenase subunit delta
MAKPRIAIFDLACCEGCQLQIVNMEDELLQLLTLVDPVEWREAMSDQSDHYDIAIIEGSVTRPADEARVRDIRFRAQYVIALGACAMQGGVNKLKNNFSLQEVKKEVYGYAANQAQFDTFRTKALGEVIKVDFEVPGCPIEASELAHVIKCLLTGQRPKLADQPVCVECKMKANCCRYDYDEVCLGPITRAGCDARCPSNGFWCFGCRGILPDANMDAAREAAALHGKSFEDLQSKLELFGSE